MHGRRDVLAKLCQARSVLLEIGDDAEGALLIHDRDVKFRPSFDSILQSEEMAVRSPPPPRDRRGRSRTAVGASYSSRIFSGKPSLALGHRTSMLYDFAGRLVASVDSLGLKTTAVYDPLGHRTIGVCDDGQRRGRSHDRQHRPAGPTDDVGLRRRGSGDRLRRSARTPHDDRVRPGRSSERFRRSDGASYDLAGRTVESTNAESETTTTVYDLAGRSVASVGPTYDFASRIQSVWKVSPRGLSTRS